MRYKILAFTSARAFQPSPSSTNTSPPLKVEIEKGGILSLHCVIVRGLYEYILFCFCSYHSNQIIIKDTSRSDPGG